MTKEEINELFKQSQERNAHAKEAMIKREQERNARAKEVMKQLDKCIKLVDKMLEKYETKLEE